MKKIILVVLILLSSCASHKDTIQKTGISWRTFYSVDYKIKRLFRPDTLNLKYEILIETNHSKPCVYKIIDKDRTTYYLDGLTYIFYNKDKKYYMVERQGNRLYSMILPVCDIKRELSEDSIKLSEKTASITISRILKSKDKRISKFQIDYIINKKKQVLNKKRTVFFDNEVQYEEWNFSNYKYSNDMNFSLRKEVDSLKMVYAPAKIKTHIQKEKLLDHGKMPEIKGRLINEKDIFSTNDLNGKMILYDFWHIACYPCILSIPELNRLKEKYKEKLEIIGVNPIDHDVAKLKEFIKKYHITYRVLLTSDISEIHVNYYPSIIIVNREGKIIFSDNKGYSKDLFKDVDNLLRKNF